MNTVTFHIERLDPRVAGRIYKKYMDSKPNFPTHITTYPWQMLYQLVYDMLMRDAELAVQTDWTKEAIRSFRRRALVA